MYRRTKVGLIIWGAIISGVGAIVLAAGGGIAGAIVLGFGCCFLIPGIILAITTSVHNNNVKTDNQCKGRKFPAAQKLPGRICLLPGLQEADQQKCIHEGSGRFLIEEIWEAKQKMLDNHGFLC